MPLDNFFSIPQYSLNQQDKNKMLFKLLSELNHHHLKYSSDYAKIINTLYPEKHNQQTIQDIPYLPVGLFKKHDLLTIPKENIFKTLTSSGTTSSSPSKIYLDAQTAQRQTQALANIMTSFLGNKRVPMLIIDTPSVIKNRKSFSARGAGILGMYNFGRYHLYVLDEQMRLNKEVLLNWIQQYQDHPVLIFGFTFMVWKYFLELLAPNEISLPRGILIHSGGWKKLQDEAVSNKKFKETLKEKTGITRCHSFYGMVEQVGSVFVECEMGYLHTPNFADIIIRHPRSWNSVPIGEEGVIQTLSILPKSYPGHSLLTEDLGFIVADDNCKCGRKGRYFQVIGRVPKTELRGCSDTHAYSTQS